jgi:hypothetical protein
MTEWSGAELAIILADAAKTLAAQDSLARTAEELVGLAVSVVPGAESASLSLAHNGTVETLAATDELAQACDAAQYATSEGPCLQAVWEDRIIRVDDFASEPRWPAFSKRANELGAGSLLACHLSSVRGSLSALNLYARSPAAFNNQSYLVASIYAAHATIALESTRLEDDLRIAVETRQGIGQAVGIVMERHKLSAKQAFDVLVQSSQQINVKLRDLANLVVNTGIDPGNTGLLARVAGQDPSHGSTQEHAAAAQAHERAALSHERQAELDRANVAEHERQAAFHREAAEQARAAAREEFKQLEG